VPGIFTGLRLGLIYALVNIIGMEFLIDFGGLGRIVSEMYFRFEIPGMYVAIVLIVLVSWTFLYVLSRLELWLRPR
jgi:ABC-type nitrate/sulfonate/bicarbonate transport system permease component